MSSDELTYLTASRLGEVIRERQVSSVEVVEAHLRRIDQINPTLNAVVQLDRERALAAAASADQRQADGGSLGQLNGVPFTVKDWIETEGLICAAGIAARASYIPKRDATVVRRLREAGAILIAKTNVADGGELHPRPNNPYDLERTTGGSSSGEAALIAAGGSPLGLGSDSGGSIRFPAHCCGVAGLKPSAGLVPTTGHFPRIAALADPRTQIGPMARSVADLALVLPLIAGMDWRDPGVIPIALRDPAKVTQKDVRIGWYDDSGLGPPDEATSTVLDDAVRLLKARGCSISRISPPRIEEALPITRDYWRRPESVSLREWLPDGEFSLSSEQIEKHIFEWDRFRREMLGFIEDYDVLLTPAAQAPAQPHGGATAEDYIHSVAASLTGWPAVVVRAGTSTDGLPIGVQLTGAPYRDDMALAAATAIEADLGGWQPPPI